MKAELIYKALEDEFRPDECTDVFPKKGLQHHFADEMDTVYTATFAGDEVFEKLIELDAKNCLLFTHHPVPQREDILADPQPIAEKWQKMMAERNISLFSYHIPLDRNGPYSPGNNLAKRMGLRPYKEFYEQNGVRMGVMCNSDFKTADEVAECLAKVLGNEVKLYNYGGNELKDGKIAMMCGGAKSTDVYKEMADEGINLFIVGVTTKRAEWVQNIHKAAEEHGVSLLGGTHQATEKFAPAEMVVFFEKLGLKAYFIDETPRINEL